ncbi:MAG: SH3 domain-containing protein [Chloroflexota bacterium]|nr:SH3 domain-containing protein [Chloroflexota bacterium]
MVFAGGGAADYLTWANQQGTGDVSFDSWREISLQQYKAEQEQLEANLEQIGYSGPESLFGQGEPVAPASTAPAGGGVTPLADRVNVRAAPGIGSDIAAIAPAGLPMRVLGTATIEGETWIEVSLPGGRTGWVRSDLLATAAD